MIPTSCEDFIKQFPWATFGRLETTADFSHKYEEQCARVSLLRRQPLISLVLVECPGRDVETTVKSVLSQSYPHWELVVVTTKSILPVKSDRRVKYFSVGESSPALAKNTGIRNSTGAWVGFIEPGDILSPVALFSCLVELEKQEKVNLIFSNEAKIDRHKSKITDFMSKPALHWFNLLHLNAVGRFWMAEASSLHALGLFDETLKSEEEFDLFHRADLVGWNTLHLPMYLYYRAYDETVNVTERRLIVEKYVKNRGMEAFVHSTGGRIDVQPILKNPTAHKVSVVVLFKDKPDWTLKAIESLAKQKGQVPLELILVNNGSSEASWEKVADGIKQYKFDIQLVDYLDAFNFGHINNWAVRTYSTGDLVLLLNNDVFLTGDNQIDLMASWAEKEWVGTVGIRLHYEHGSIQHSGLDARFGGNGRLVRVGNGNGRDPFALINHLVFGNTFACCMLKRQTFDALGGFRELDLANGFGDIAFNFECLKNGFKNIYLGTLRGTHLESASRGLSYEYWEECILERDYPEILQQMLREDLAMDRVPGNEAALFEEVKNRILQELRMRAPWLKRVKRVFDKNILTLKKTRHLEA